MPTLLEAGPASRSRAPEGDGVIDLREQPWWTEADRAELDLHVHELVDRHFEHRKRCSSCAAGSPDCPFTRVEISRVIDWRDNRVLRSRATWLRRVADQRAELGHLPETIEGCIAVLGVAARIIRIVGGHDPCDADERRQQ